MDGEAPAGGGADGGQPALLRGQALRVGVAHALDAGDQRVGRRRPCPGSARGRSIRQHRPPPGRAPAAACRSPGTAASRAIAAWICVERRQQVADQHRRAHAAAAAPRAAARCRPRRPLQRIGQPVQPGPAVQRPRAAGAISRTRSPPRSSSAASASSSSPARSAFSTGWPRDFQRIEAPPSRHRHTVCAASHSVSRTIGAVGAGRDCRQSMRLIVSPGRNGRNCQKLSPWPTRRRPCTPCATVAATRSAATSSGGRCAPSASARRAAEAHPMRSTSRSIMPPSGQPSARRGELQRHAVAQHRLRQRRHVLDARRQPPVQHRARPRRQHQRLRRARAGAPGDVLAHRLVLGCSPAGRRAPGAGSPPPPSRPPARGGSAPAPPSVPRRSAPASARASAAPVVASSMARSASQVGIAHVDLQQEAVELRLRQRIGAFLLDRVLRRQHVERPRQRMLDAADRDALLLHRLQQRRLGARAWRG